MSVFNEILNCMTQDKCYAGMVLLNHRIYGKVYSYVFYNIDTDDLYFLDSLEDDLNNFEFIKFVSDTKLIELIGE